MKRRPLRTKGDRRNSTPLRRVRSSERARERFWRGEPSRLYRCLRRRDPTPRNNPPASGTSPGGSCASTLCRSHAEGARQAGGRRRRPCRVRESRAETRRSLPPHPIFSPARATDARRRRTSPCPHRDDPDPVRDRSAAKRTPHTQQPRGCAAPAPLLAPQLDSNRTACRGRSPGPSMTSLATPRAHVAREEKFKLQKKCVSVEREVTVFPCASRV